MTNRMGMDEGDLKEICRLYEKEGLTTKEIGNKFDRSRSTIDSILNEEGVDVEKHRVNSLIPDEILNNREWIIEKYKSGLSMPEIADQIDGVQANSIMTCLERNGVERRNQKEAQRQYELDDTAFEEINEGSAYWIGFILADGCIYDKWDTRSDKLSIRLKESDKGHLKKFRNFMNTDKPIQHHRKREHTQVSIELSSDKVCSDLADFGIVPNKTSIAEADGRLEDNRHFWRGVIDGDGCLSCSNDKYNYLTIKICGTESVASSFRGYASSFVDSRPKIMKKDAPPHSCSFTGSSANVIASRLYEDCSVYLDRKYEIAKDYF